MTATYEQVSALPLTEALAWIGFRHVRDQKTWNDHRHVVSVSKTNEVLGRYDAHEAWGLVADHFGRERLWGPGE